ncbi:MAG: hypothetical protein V8Q05_11075 [Lachnospiraceae bacterium]
MGAITNYVTGDFFEGDEPDALALGSYDFIARDLNDIKRSYFRLGFHLNEFDRCKYYQQFGYTCLSDFVLHNWGLEPSFVSRCIAVFLFTAKYSGALPTMFQEEKYQPYSYSQLVEMISMDDDTLRLCTPNYSVRELREIKKNAKKRKEIATSQSEKKFDFEKYMFLHGAAGSAYIKSCDALGDLKGIFVVDCDGKEILNAYNTFCEVLQDNSDRIVVRLCQRS